MTIPADHRVIIVSSSPHVVLPLQASQGGSATVDSNKVPGCCLFKAAIAMAVLLLVLSIGFHRAGIGLQGYLVALADASLVST